MKRVITEIEKCTTEFGMVEVAIGYTVGDDDYVCKFNAYSNGNSSNSSHGNGANLSRLMRAIDTLPFPMPMSDNIHSVRKISIDIAGTTYINYDVRFSYIKMDRKDLVKNGKRADVMLEFEKIHMFDDDMSKAIRVVYKEANDFLDTKDEIYLMLRNMEERVVRNE